MFADSTQGIKRLVSAYQQVDGEFKGRRDELQTLKAKYDAIVKSINETQKIADPKTIQAKADEAEALKYDIERKQQDGQKALEKRTKELTEPIFADIGNALRAYAKQRGIDMIFDVSKFTGTVMLINESVDITSAFIGEYNSKNAVVPAGVPVKTP